MPLEPYDEQAELKDIATRYERVFARLPLTLPRLRQDVIYRNLVRRLRSDGWRDWHILQAVMSGVINWHLARMGLDRDLEAMQSTGDALARRFLEQGEIADDPPVPPAYFTPKTMELLLHTGLMTFLEQICKRLDRRAAPEAASDGDHSLPASLIFLSFAVKRKGAVFRDRGYDFEKMRVIATERYHYLELDVPHSPLFPDELTSANTF